MLMQSNDVCDCSHVPAYPLATGFVDLSTGVSQLEGLLERQAELEAREAELNEQVRRNISARGDGCKYTHTQATSACVSLYFLDDS